MRVLASELQFYKLQVQDQTAGFDKLNVISESMIQREDCWRPMKSYSFVIGLELRCVLDCFVYPTLHLLQTIRSREISRSTRAPSAAPEGKPDVRYS